MTSHINTFQKNKITVSLMVKDKNYNKIWGKKLKD